MTLREMLSDIHALKEEMLAFERKYGVRSETFYAAYLSGEEPEDDRWVLDFTEWASGLDYSYGTTNNNGNILGPCCKV